MIASADRIARTASSSRITGTPNTPTRASPMNFPTVAPAAGFGPAERRRSRTYRPWGYHGLPVLKTAEIWLCASDCR
jgi:hypothetical protein